MPGKNIQAHTNAHRDNLALLGEFNPSQGTCLEVNLFSSILQLGISFFSRPLALGYLLGLTEVVFAKRETHTPTTNYQVAFRVRRRFEWPRRLSMA